MTYITAQPLLSDSWDDICYPVEPVWLKELLPDYDIMATDRQQLIVGHPDGGRKTIFGIQSADYTIIRNSAIRDVIDTLLSDYTLQIKHTTTGEFSISIVMPEELYIGGEHLHRNLIITNSYNGKTPFSVQGQTLASMQDSTSLSGSSMYRTVCKNGLIGWADQFSELSAYRKWLKQWSTGKQKTRAVKAQTAENKAALKTSTGRNARNSQPGSDYFQDQLHGLLASHLKPKQTLTMSIYEELQKTDVTKADENILKNLPIPVQLAKQAHERLRLEERLLGADPSYWLLYNAVNYALFNARSSLTLNDRFKLDERVFHHLAARCFA